MSKFGLKLADKDNITLHLFRKARAVRLTGEFPTSELAESFFELLLDLFELEER